MATHNLIQTVTVGSGGAASIEFTSIPQTYTDLLVLYSLRGSQAQVYTQASLTFNASSTGYYWRMLQGTGTSIGNQSVTNGSSIGGFNGTGSSATANTFGNLRLYIPNYSGSQFKSCSINDVLETNASTTYMALVAGVWTNTNAITTITMTGLNNWVQHSSASLYGISKT
jgi:hypothetical protein